MVLLSHMQLGLFLGVQKNATNTASGHTGIVPVIEESGVNNSPCFLKWRSLSAVAAFKTLN